MRARSSCQNTAQHCVPRGSWDQHVPNAASYRSSTSKQGGHSGKVSPNIHGQNNVLWLPVISLCSLCGSFRWLHGLIKTYAEPNPDKAEVHLPIGMTSDVHTMYMDEVRCGNEDLHPVSIKHFNFVWRVRVPHLKVRVFHRYRCPHLCALVFSACPKCFFLCSFCSCQVCSV